MNETQNYDGYQLLIKASTDDGRSIQKVYTIKFENSITKTTNKGFTIMESNLDQNSLTKLPHFLENTDETFVIKNVDKFPLTEFSGDFTSTKAFIFTENVTKFDEFTYSPSFTTDSEEEKSSIENSQSSFSEFTLSEESKKSPTNLTPSFAKSEYIFLVENPIKDQLIGKLEVVQSPGKARTPVHMTIDPADYSIWFHIDPRVCFKSKLIYILIKF